MTNEVADNRLHQHMAQLIALEASIEEFTGLQLNAVSAYPGGTTIIQKFTQLARSHRRDLEARLNLVASNILIAHA